MSPTPSDLDRGREAHARRAWDDAFQALSRADRVSPLGAEDLERLAFSAGLSGRSDAFLASYERLHHLHLEAGDPLRAAHSAFWLGFRLVGLGEIARASGWFARAERLIEGQGECALSGYLMLPLVHRQLAGGQLDAAFATADAAARIGERFGERDLTAFARLQQGQILVRQGEIARGMALLDEVMVAVTSDELSPAFTGMIYCTVIWCCRGVFALERARQWTTALSTWCDAQPQLVPFTGDCLVHRAEILQLHGEWQEAIAEARRASELFARAAETGRTPAEASYQAAEIHRLRGEFTAADEAYRVASRQGLDPQPGLALLRLAQGKKETAAGGIRQAAAAAREALQRARLLPAYVEIMLAVGDLEEARRGAAELEETAARMDSGILGAMAAHARGAVDLAEGDARGAVASLRSAFAVWQQVGAPYLAARLRVLIARACEALGDREGAQLERDAARGVFAELGAAPDLAQLEAGTRGGRSEAARGLTQRELEVLRLLATGRTNRAIAEQLFLSEKTIDRHVSNIFTKLDVSSRAAATAYAYEHQLV